MYDDERPRPDWQDSRDPRPGSFPGWWKAAAVILWLMVMAIGLMSGESLIGFGK